MFFLNSLPIDRFKEETDISANNQSVWVVRIDPYGTFIGFTRFGVEYRSPVQFVVLIALDMHTLHDLHTDDRGIFFCARTFAAPWIAHARRQIEQLHHSRAVDTAAAVNFDL